MLSTNLRMLIAYLCIILTISSKLHANSDNNHLQIEVAELQPVSSYSESSCAGLILECLLTDRHLKETCLRAVTQHQNCRNTDIQKLLDLRRLAYAGSSSNIQYRPSRAPKVTSTNLSCLEAFDKKFATLIFAQALEEYQVNHLIKQLYTCSDQFITDLLRP